MQREINYNNFGEPSLNSHNISHSYNGDLSKCNSEERNNDKISIEKRAFLMQSSLQFSSKDSHF